MGDAPEKEKDDFLTREMLYPADCSLKSFRHIIPDMAILIGLVNGGFQFFVEQLLMQLFKDKAALYFDSFAGVKFDDGYPVVLLDELMKQMIHFLHEVCSIGCLQLGLIKAPLAVKQHNILSLQATTIFGRHPQIIGVDSLTFLEVQGLEGQELFVYLGGLKWLEINFQGYHYLSEFLTIDVTEIRCSLISLKRFEKYRQNVV